MVFGAGRGIFGLFYQAYKFALEIFVHILYNNSLFTEKHMHQILKELQEGTPEVVRDNGDGTLDYRINPPSALNLRAHRLIIQLISERDNVVIANTSMAKQLHEAVTECEFLRTKLKELNDKLDSLNVQSPEPSTHNSSDSGLDSAGATESTESQAS